MKSRDLTASAPPRQRKHRNHEHEQKDQSNDGEGSGTALDMSSCKLLNLHDVVTTPGCTRLSVLCLRNTSLVEIKPLDCCPRLVHLDLSSNEITNLLDGDFWGSFPELMVLLLHENKVEDWQTAMSLGQAQGLVYLTLYCNPISKVKMYRTIMVNCCASLRGIDGYVISDEEIIEGVSFPEGNPYRTCSSMLVLPQVLATGPWEDISSISGGGHRRARRESTRLDHPNATEVASLYPVKDEEVMRRVALFLRLLQGFHASVSPVIICQRQMRRFIRYRRQSSAATIIQAHARMWVISRRAMSKLKELLRETGRLHLMEELVAPVQFQETPSFEQSLATSVLTKMRENSARRLAIFISRMKKRFFNFTLCLKRARVEGIVVASRYAGDLRAAVTRAIVSITPGLCIEEAVQRATKVVAVIPSCRVLRSFSYADVPDWPFLEGDIDTDGIFITTFVEGTRRTTLAERHSLSPMSTTGGKDEQPPSSLREGVTEKYAQQAMGLFSGTRVRSCLIKRRGFSTRRRSRQDASCAGGVLSGKGFCEHDRLWAFDSVNAGLLAHVLCALRRRTAGRGPIPCIFQRQMYRCAAATRLQAAWRGHVTRWNVLLPLESCLIVQRATICLQRWWRQLAGLTARLRLCRRLWALASEVSSSTMYIELGVYFALTNGWKPTDGKETVSFAVRSDGKVVRVRRAASSCPRRHGDAAVQEIPGTASGGDNPPGVRALPLWVFASVIPEALSSDVSSKEVSHDVGALLSEDVRARSVVWPLEPLAADMWHTTVPESRHGDGSLAKSQVVETHPKHSTNPRIIDSESKGTGRAHALSHPEGLDTVGGEEQLDLSRIVADGDLVEMRFSSAREARARALLLAIATVGSGTGRRPYFAQLMTLGMLRRVASGEHGVSFPAPIKPLRGYGNGDSVEVLASRGFDKRARRWQAGVIESQNRDGSFRVSCSIDDRVCGNCMIDDRVCENCMIRFQVLL